MIEEKPTDNSEDKTKSLKRILENLPDDEKKKDYIRKLKLSNDEVELKISNFVGSVRYILTNKGIYYERFQPPYIDKNGPHEGFWTGRETIYSGFIIPMEHLRVDNASVFSLQTFEKKCLTMDDILNYLRSEGGIVNDKGIRNALNAVFLNLTEKEGHATYGIYKNSNKLFLCKEIMPFKDEQIRTAERCNINYPISKETIIPFIEASKLWHTYEYLPAMGMSVMAPFALLLRSKCKLIAIIWHYGPKSHLGKSTVNRIFSELLFGLITSSGDSIKTPFRFLDKVDSICGYVVISEADNIPWSELNDIIKTFPENYIAGKRGRTNLKSDEYLSRAGIGISSNRFSIKDETSIVRILKIPFDVTKEGERNLDENNKKLDDLLVKMKPVGWRIVEDELKYVNYSFDNLIDNINKHEDELRKYGKYTDPRRPFSWAVIYEGLQVWDRICKQYQIDWRAPTYQEFYDNVVKIIELESKESGTVPIADFVDWWIWWMEQNKRRIAESDIGETTYTDRIVGENVFWANKTLTYKGEDYDGWIITNAVLRNYQKDRDARIDSLSDIGKSVMTILGIPKDEIIKRWNIGSKTCWAVFIPKNIFNYGVVKEEWKEVIDNNKTIKNVGLQEVKTKDDDFDIDKVEF